MLPVRCRDERRGEERRGEERRDRRDSSLQRSRVRTCADPEDYGTFRCLRSPGHLQQVVSLRDEGPADLGQ